MRLYDRTALDAYARTLPTHSPASAFVLPSGVPILPPFSDKSGLAERIRRELRSLYWASSLLALEDELAAVASSSSPSSSLATDASAALKRSSVLSSDHVLVGLPTTSQAPSSVQTNGSSSTSSTAVPRRSAVAILTTRRLLLLIALLATLVVVLFLSLSLDAEEIETVHIPFARGLSNNGPLLPVPTDNDRTAR
jgi:hypothetical protein